MPPEATSKHLRNATELTLVADVKPGLVEVRETRSYATRLGILLGTLQAIRQKAVEASLREAPYAGPLEKLQALHFVRWTLLDNGTKLMLAVSFDGPWEPYMRRIVDVAGPLLDVILCNCEGYDAHASDQGHTKFVEWVRAHQVESQFFHANAPTLTADDLRFLSLLESQQRLETDLEKFDRQATDLRVRDLSRRLDPTPALSGAEQERVLEAEMRALGALHRLSALFPASEPSRGALHLKRTAHMILPRLEDGPLPDLQEKLHASALAWYRDLPSRAIAVPGPDQVNDAAIVQGNVLEPYVDRTHGCLLLLRIADRARASAFLRALAGRVTIAAGAAGPAFNVGFSFAGLRALGLTDAELQKLPKEFREGMEARAGFLGDVGPSHPDFWAPPLLADGTAVELSAVDLVIQVQAQADASDDDHVWTDQHPLYGTVTTLLTDSGLEQLAVEVLRRDPPDARGIVREHFGYRDGISQPKPGGPANDPDTVPVGEILLGYANERGDDGKVFDLLKDGTFLVIRKLEQDVGRFRQLLSGYSRLPAKQEQLAARMMGRYRDGRPVVDPNLGADANDFRFDVENQTPCPPSAHIRRANPRTERPHPTPAGTRPAPTPRIMRRGFSYGSPFSPDTLTEPRGLFFMAYNASIAEQFEVIQRWISGGNSTGVLSADADPFLGLRRPGAGQRVFRSATTASPVAGAEHGVERVGLGTEPLVSLRWGMYLFVPSTVALEQLADRLLQAPRLPEGDPARGRVLIAKLDATLRVLAATQGEAAANARMRIEWKKLIEDVSTQDAAQDLWAAVRDLGGVLRTPYGVLLGSAEHVMTAFRDDDRFSVRDYWERMNDSLGALYLGMDPAPQVMEDGGDRNDLDARYHAEVSSTRYAEEAAAPNAWIAGIPRSDAFALALAETSRQLAGIASAQPGARIAIDLRGLVGNVLARLSRHWFALPDGDEMQAGGPVEARPDGGVPAHCPDNFLATARYIFSPNPTAFVVAEGRARGHALLDAAKRYVQNVADGVSDLPPGTLFAELMPTPPNPPGAIDVDRMARTLVGSVHGFVGPCFGTLSSVLYLWQKTGLLWRNQYAHRWARDRLGEAAALEGLERALVATMQLRPLPYILHRTVTRSTRLGGVDLAPGDRVVLGLLSGTRQRRPDDGEILFGGTYGGDNAHACPGRELAMGVMLGTLTSLLDFGRYRSEAPLLLSTLRPGS